MRLNFQYSSLILILWIVGIGCRSKHGQILDSIQRQIDNISYNQSGILSLQKAISRLDSLKIKCSAEEPKLVIEIDNVATSARKKISSINRLIFENTVDLYDLDYTYSEDKLEQKIREIHNFVRTHQLDPATNAYVDSIRQKINDRVEMYRRIARNRERQKRELLRKIRNGKANYDDFAKALEIGLKLTFHDVARSYPGNIKQDIDTSSDGYLVVSYYGMRGGRYVVLLFKFKGLSELIDIDQIYGDNRFRSRLLR